MQKVAEIFLSSGIDSPKVQRLCVMWAMKICTMRDSTAAMEVCNSKTNTSRNRGAIPDNKGYEGDHLRRNYYIQISIHLWCNTGISDKEFTILAIKLRHKV